MLDDLFSSHIVLLVSSSRPPVSTILNGSIANGGAQKRGLMDTKERLTSSGAFHLQGWQTYLFAKFTTKFLINLEYILAEFGQYMYVSFDFIDGNNFRSER